MHTQDKPAPKSDIRRFERNVHGSADAVRHLLQDLRTHLSEAGVDSDTCGTVEICLAEALNNIVEHAYAPACEGPIWLTAQYVGAALTIDLRDEGHPLPDFSLPAASLPDASGPIDSLPEGGFGWYLLHTLSENITYRREGARNCLSMGFVVKN